MSAKSDSAWAAVDSMPAIGYRCQSTNRRRRGQQSDARRSARTLAGTGHFATVLVANPLLGDRSASTTRDGPGCPVWCEQPSPIGQAYRPGTPAPALPRNAAPP